jgi:murein DD-endopeptidase MepM/ murein hydrolase activator NlpD
LFVILCGLIYGFYGLTQQGEHLRIERENRQLRAENDKQRQQLQNLNNRVDAVEDASRKLAEVSGMDKDAVAPHGQGGPARPVNSAAALAALEAKTARLEREMRMYEAFLRSRGVSRGVIPSIWPVYGKLESGVGGRRNPFTGRGHEYHEGQDIDAAWGTPVEAAAAGKVIIAGWQRGYGNVVYVDHGSGLSTRYGHLSKINVSVGQSIDTGEIIGLVGSTGRSTGPHLHYEVRVNNQPVDPKPYLPGATQNSADKK